MKLKPTDDRIVLRPLEEAEKTAGGIFLPSASREKPMKFKVIAVGPGQKLKSGKRRQPDLKIGDMVLLAKWSGSDIKVDGEEFKIARESDILAKVE